MLKKIRKGLKKFMNDAAKAGKEILYHSQIIFALETGKEILSDRQSRLTLGLVLVGAGVGMVVSAYVHAPVI